MPASTKILFPLSIARSLAQKNSSSLMDQSTLVLTQIFFRHGHRSPDQKINYPGDPYHSEPYLPFGKGELTMKGRKQSYAFGQRLRERYSKFLGPEYYQGLSDATSSEVSRARTTLQLVLAGLFPPTSNTKIDNSLNWQPIPFSYTQIKEDLLIGRAILQMYQHEDHPDFRKTANSQEVIKCIAEKLKWDVRSHAQCLLVFDTVKTQIDFGLEMPEWCAEIYPHKLKLEFDKFVHHNFGRKQFLIDGHGHMIKKIHDMMSQKINEIENEENKLSVKMPKICLYSGHDINLAGLLSILGNFQHDQWPNFMSNLTFELHRIDSEFYVKILYQDGFNVNEDKEESELTWKTLKLQKFSEDMCKLSDFTQHVQQYFPQPQPESA